MHALRDSAIALTWLSSLVFSRLAARAASCADASYRELSPRVVRLINQ